MEKLPKEYMLPNEKMIESAVKALGAIWDKRGIPGVEIYIEGGKISTQSR